MSVTRSKVETFAAALDLISETARRPARSKKSHLCTFNVMVTEYAVLCAFEDAVGAMPALNKRKVARFA